MMAQAATTVAARKSQNCHSMSERFRKPKAAPRLRMLIRSKKPGITTTGRCSGMAVMTHHLLSWSSTKASAARPPMLKPVETILVSCGRSNRRKISSTSQLVYRTLGTFIHDQGAR